MIQTNEKLKELGARLRSERLRRNETQAIFAARVGVSIPTIRKMESGDPGVLVGYWMTALEMLGRSDEIDGILVEPEDLFAKYERATPIMRQRASRKRP